MVKILSGGMMYTWLRWTAMPWETSRTGMLVALERSCARALSCWGARCWMITTAVPVRAGRALRNADKASSPPAEAPTPTMGKEAGDWGGAIADFALRRGLAPRAWGFLVVDRFFSAISEQR